MAHPSDRALLVLHTMRLKGFADAEPVARATGLLVDDVVTEFEKARDEGLAFYRDGRISGWQLTQEGRTHAGAAVTAEMDACDCRSLVVDAYRRFLTVNADLLTVCTDWQ